MDGIRRFEAFLQELSRGELEAVNANIARDYFDSSPAEGDLSAAENLLGIVRDLRKAMPDLSFKATDLHEEDGLLRGSVGARGRHTGDLWGAPGSGDTVEWTVDVAVKPIGDRFAIKLENVQVPEVLGALRKLHVVNPPDQMHLPPRYPVSIPDNVLQLVFNGQAAEKPCSHFDMIKVTEPTTDKCEQCVASGDIWPALRMCLTCGFVGCCDTSTNKHMKQHSEATGHVIFRSIRMQESWFYCYADNAFFPGRRLNRFRAEAV